MEFGQGKPTSYTGFINEKSEAEIRADERAKIRDWIDKYSKAFVRPEYDEQIIVLRDLRDFLDNLGLEESK